MFQVCIVGTSSAIPAFGRHLSSQVVLHNSNSYLIDCGEATQFQLLKYRLEFLKLESIFLSHLHGDHLLGLPGLLTTMNMLGRTRSLLVVGPVGIRDFIEYHQSLLKTRFTYTLEIREWEYPSKGMVVYENASLVVKTIPLQHRIECSGYLFEEKSKPKKLLIERVHALGIPVNYYHLLKQGNDIRLNDGRMVRAADVLGEAKPSYRYAYCSDTCYSPAIIPYIQGVDLLYHEATFLHTLKSRADETGHSTAREAAQIAQAAGVKKLLLGHFSARYRDLNPFLEEARSIFQATELAEEGKQYNIEE